MAEELLARINGVAQRALVLLSVMASLLGLDSGALAGQPGGTFALGRGCATAALHQQGEARHCIENFLLQVAHTLHRSGLLRDELR